MKKILFALVGALALVVSCGKDKETPQPQIIAVTGITLNTDILELIEGESAILTATVYPENATDPSVTWKSSSEAVATVVDGVVTAVAAGEATITAKAGDKAVACTVTVVSAYVAVESITLDAVELSLEVGESMTLISTVLPENATDKMVTWSSGDESIATVADGVVTAIAPGQTVITAKAGDKEATCDVIVRQPKPAVKALVYEELPSMKTARKGHVSFATDDGDIVVAGGHTTGFALTQTAERLHDGAWESLSIAHPHDGSSVTRLPDGRVLVCGGFSSGSGVGQSKVTDIYDASTHSFSSAAALVQDRAMAVGVLTGVDNHVLLSGNWYNSDQQFELWDGSGWTSFGSKSAQMHDPFMVSGGDGVVYVFGCFNPWGNNIDLTVYKVNTKEKTVQELGSCGMSEYVPWHRHGSFGVDPASSLTPQGALLFIAKKSTKDSDPTYLMCFDPATENAKELAALPTAIEGLNQTLYYSSNVLVNKDRGEAYVIGCYGTNGHISITVFAYQLSTGKSTLYHGGDFNTNFASGSWTIQPTTGTIIFTGGTVSSNFDPQPDVIAVTPFE